MKSLLLLILVLVVSTKSDVPTDCYTVEHELYDECYTFSNQVTATQPTAKNTCASSGGQLAIIKNESTWKLLIEQFLKGFANNIWLGYEVDSSSGTTLIPTFDLRNLTNYWSSNSLSSQYRGYCLYAQQSSWKWQLSSCSNLNIPYFCQYNLSCNISDVYQPHVKVDRCNSAEFIRHNATIDVKCEYGYFLNNASVIRCLKGNLTEKPQCILGCPPPGQRRNAILTSVKENYNIGETVYYVCENNYFNRQNHQIAHFSITCQADSTWSDNDASCSVKHPFSTTIIDVKPDTDRRIYADSILTTTINSKLASNDIELRCDLNLTEKLWLRNGKYIDGISSLDASIKIKLRKGFDTDGFYICVGKVNNKLQLGSKAYELVERKQCETTQKTEIEATEGENLLLVCPHVTTDHYDKWYKDDEELVSNENQNFIPNTGLYLLNVTLQDEGIYKCQTTKKENQSYCAYNVTHDVSVIASAKSVCGTKRSSTKKYQPWLAVLRHSDEIVPFCYGTLINNKWIVTSAFCLLPLQRKRVLDGYTVQFGPTSNENIFPIAAVKIHPLYRPRRTPHDVGLVQIANAPVKFFNNYLPACISPEDIDNIHKCEQFADLNGTVTGWGSLMGDVDENGLDVEEMSLVSKEICRNSKTMGFAEDKFCAKFSGKFESFAGDSGSPFLVNHNGRNYLLGIYTWGERETLSGNYDYFTSIYEHYDWIKKIMS